MNATAETAATVAAQALPEVVVVAVKRALKPTAKIAAEAEKVAAVSAEAAVAIAAIAEALVVTEVVAKMLTTAIIRRNAV